MSEHSPWAPVGPVASLLDAGSPVTLVEGASFCLSGRTGDIDPQHAQGVFFLDTRLVSRWQLAVDGRPLEPLAVTHGAPYEATFLGRACGRPGQADSDVIVFRHRHIGRGMREQMSVRNYGQVALELEISLALDTDFADVFSVKESRARRPDHLRSRCTPDGIRFSHAAPWGKQVVAVEVSPPAEVDTGQVTWRARVPPKDSVELCVEVSLAVDDQRFEPRFRCGVSDASAVPRVRLERWHADAPRLSSDRPALDRAVNQSVQDLGALRIFDPDHPDSPVVAAGAPWFMTLFGRDSLIASWMSLIIDPSLAAGVVATLARLQGKAVDDRTEEEPGKILHEVRFDRSATLALGGGSVYYGSVDATPLFVMLLGELRRWGLADDLVEELLPHADRALAWLADFGDADGDGYVEYRRKSEQGLANQGWKDSWDGVNFADGRLARSPVALCEVQGYTYAAYNARAYFALEGGDQETFERYHVKALALRTAFNRDFWLADRGWFAVGLDADKQPIDALASNMGHCLWTGIVDEDKAAAVADRLLSPELFSGWGIRTLASSMSRYNPVSYHNGSVWPHDNALIVAGLVRYGFLDHARRVIDGLLDAASAMGGRLPELFSGLDRGELSVPASYPASCSPQAWAAATPLQFLRTMLQFDPSVRHRRIHLASRPLGLSQLELREVAVDGRRLTVEYQGGTTQVQGLDGLVLDEAPRPPLSPAGSQPD